MHFGADLFIPRDPPQSPQKRMEIEAPWSFVILSARPVDLLIPRFGSGVIDTENWFENLSDPDFWKDTQHESAKPKLGFWGHEPMTPGYRVFGSSIQENWFQNTQRQKQNTGKLISKSDSATPICTWPLGPMVSAKTNLLGFWGHEPMTPGYPVLGQGSSIQENWFQNRIQRPRFAMEGHPTRYGFGKNKTWFLGSRTHDPWVPSFGSGVIDTGKLVSKSDSATPICYGRTPNTIWFRQKQNLVFGVTNPWPLGTQFWVRGHRYRKTGFKIGFSDPDLLWKDTQHDMVSAKTKLGFWGHEPMTPGYPVLGQGSSIQENWFQNRIQRPRFAMEGHPTRYGFGKNKTWFLGSRTHDPWVPSFGSGVIDTGKLVSKSDSATPICYGRTPNTIWFRQKQNLVFGVTNPWPLGTQFWVRGHRYRKTGFKIGLSDPDLLWKDTQHDMVRQKEKNFFFLICIISLIS